MDVLFRLLEEVNSMSGLDDDEDRNPRDRSFAGVALVGAGIAIGLIVAIVALKLL